MSNIQIILSRDIYQDNVVEPITLTNPLYVGDNLAQRVRFRVFRRHGDIAPVDMSSLAIRAYFARPDDGTVMMDGVSGKEWSYVDLPAACYAYPGTFDLVIKSVADTAETTIMRVMGELDKLVTGTLVDPGTDVGNIEEIVEAFHEIDSARNTCVEAAGTSTAAAETATAASEAASADAHTASEAAASAQESAQAAGASAANASESETSASGSAAAAAASETNAAGSATEAAGSAADAAASKAAAQAAQNAAQAAQTAAETAASEEVADWLAAHVNPETGYVLDNTLAIEGAAADAKAAGDAIGNLKSAIDIVTADVSVPVGSASHGYWEIANDVATKQSASSGFYYAFNPIDVSEGQLYTVTINCNSGHPPIILANYSNDQYDVVDTKTVSAQRTNVVFEFAVPAGVTHMLLTRFGNSAPGATVTFKGQRVDTTLSVTGIAADAKATGDAIEVVDAKTDALNDGIAYADKQIEKINDTLIKSVGEGQPILRNKIISLNYGGNFATGSDSDIRVATDPVYVPEGAQYTVTASGFGRVAYTRSGNGTTIYDGHTLNAATTFEHTFTGPEYFRIEFANATDTEITPDDISITITNSAAVLTDLVEKTEGIYPASSNVFVKIGDSIGSNIVATYKKMYVRNNNGVIQLSTDSGQTWNSGFDVSSLGLINNYHLFANGCIGFYTHQKAYYSEDYETYTEAPVYEADGVTPYVPSEIVNFFTSRQDQNRKFVGNQDLYVFGNYVITDEANTRKVLFATVDNGHSYKVIYEFNIAGNRSIRHVHYVVYDPNNDHYLVCTGDSDVQSYVIQLDYNSTNDTWTLTDLGHSIKYKWAGVAFYSNYVYFCYDNTPGKLCRCKYEDIGNVSKHEVILDNLPCDAIGLYIGERGDIIVTLSSARTGTNNSPFGKIIDVHRVYYSADGVHFENFIGDNPGGYAESHYYSFLGVNEDGRAITGFKPYLTTIVNWNKLPSFDLAEMVKKHGYINAMKPYDTTWEIRPVTAVECENVSVAVGSTVTITPKLYPWNASKLDGLNFEIIDYDSAKVSVSGAVITGVATGTTTAKVRSRTTYEAYAEITITVT